MIKQSHYKANLTGVPFLFFETKELAKLRFNKTPKEEIEQLVFNENLFQYKTQKSISKIYNALSKRLDLLDDNFLEMLSHFPADEGKIIDLYLIYKSNLLFADFLMEIIREKMATRQYVLDKADLNTFFQNKIQQDQDVASWKEYTIYKLKQVFRKILLDANILDEKNKLQPPFINPKLKNHLLELKEQSFVSALEGR